jgi:hypothetical protein
MKSSIHSTNNSQFQSITSKSSSSSITSILRDSSPDRPRKKNTVRFDDSPTVSIYSDAHPPDMSWSSSPPSKPGSKSSSPSQSKVLSPTRPLEKKASKLSLNKKAPIKAIQSPEPKTEPEEKKNTPKVISYSFRNQGFYQKLNRFYSTEAPVKEPERIFIRLNPQSFKEEAIKPGKLMTHVAEKSLQSVRSEHSEPIELTEPRIIHLRPCSSQSSRGKSPQRETKPYLKRGRGQNILN